MNHSPEANAIIAARAVLKEVAAARIGKQDAIDRLCAILQVPDLLQPVTPSAPAPEDDWLGKT